MDVKAKDLLIYGGIAIGLYLLYQALKPLAGTLSTAVSAVGTGYNAATTGIANLWVSLTSTSMGGVLGNVVFPNGAQVPLSSMPVKTDSTGGVYVNTGGITYQLQPSDANGNWPAVAVGT